MLKFNHRLNGYDTQNPKSFELADCVGAMTDRAEATLNMIQCKYVGDANKLNDELNLNALKSILMEIKDIRSVVNHYHESQKSPDK